MASTDKSRKSGKGKQQKQVLRAGKARSDKWWMNHQLEILIGIVVVVWIALEFLIE